MNSGELALLVLAREGAGFRKDLEEAVLGSLTSGARDQMVTEINRVLGFSFTVTAVIFSASLAIAPTTN